jgi:hypothetical protein
MSNNKATFLDTKFYLTTAILFIYFRKQCWELPKNQYVWSEVKKGNKTFNIILKHDFIVLQKFPKIC